MKAKRKAAPDSGDTKLPPGLYRKDGRLVFNSEVPLRAEIVEKLIREDREVVRLQSITELAQDGSDV